jgi:hypothetical protein
MHLATAQGLHELLETTRLRVSLLTAGLGGLGRWALLGGPRLLGQVLGTVLELGLSRASGRGHVPETPNPAPPLC